MELIEKQGFKQTEVGVIPLDWEHKLLDEVSDVIDPHPSHRAPAESKIGIPFLGIGDFDERGFIKSSKQRVVGKYVLHEHNLRYNLNENLIGLGRVASIGKVVKLRNDIGEYTISPTLGVIRSKEVDHNYLRFILNSNYIKNYFKRIMSGSTRSSVGMVVLRKIPIPLPPTLQEQKAIATALSDVDALIQQLEALIAKKKAIKQGAMQELLTPPHKGGKRLPGFSGEWVEKVIGKIGNTYGGLSGKSKKDFEDGKHPYITFLNVMNNVVIDTSIFEYVHIKSGEQQNKARKGDLFFNTSSETPEEVGMCAVLNEDVGDLYLNSFCFGFRLKEDCDVNAHFFSYLINSSIGRNLFLSLAQGATRYNLSKSNFNKLTIEVPSVKEQVAIAEILSDIDKDIVHMETKKAKYQSIKHGMMQELLTGKTRLV